MLEVRCVAALLRWSVRASLSLLALASCLGGCSRREPHAPERPSPPSPAPPPVAAPPTHDEDALTLVHVEARGTFEILELPVTLWVTPREVVVLRGAATTLVPSRILGRFDPTTATEHLVPTLHGRLVEVLAHEEARQSRWPDVALVVLDGSVTMGTLVDVLYTSGRAGMAAYEFAVDTDEGPRGLSVVPPRTCERHGAADDSCVRPQILFAADGMLLSAELIGNDGCPLPPVVTWVWRGRNLSGPDGACPTAWDPAATAIPWLLDELPALGPVCRHALVSAELDVPWSRLAPAFARLHAELEHGLVIEAAAPTGCIDPFLLGR